jgi:hypothetical protein
MDILTNCAVVLLTIISVLIPIMWIVSMIFTITTIKKNGFNALITIIETFISLMNRTTTIPQIIHKRLIRKFMILLIIILIVEKMLVIMIKVMIIIMIPTRKVI